jgi:hypothetical protein
MQDMAPEVRKRPFGRSLQDCRKEGMTTPHGLWPAEEQLLEAAAKGELCIVRGGRPEAAEFDNKIDPLFLRFLLLGGDEFAPVHEKGVQLQGAFIEGDLDFGSAAIVRPLNLLHCHISGKIIGRNGRFSEIDLSGSLCHGMDFVRAHSTGDISLENEFTAAGEVSFRRAEVGGAFICTAGSFQNPSGFALYCADMKIAGGVLLDNGFKAEGRVLFSRSEIGGQFACHGGRFIQKNAAPPRDGEVPLAEDALSLVNATIKGVLTLGPASPPHNQQVCIEGSLNLQGTSAVTFVDHADSWPVPEIQNATGTLPCIIALDGFTYQRLAGTAPTDAKTRGKWLARQRPSHLAESFRPQPFEQLIKVLEEMGHTRDAREIGYLKESRRLRRPWHWWQEVNPFSWLWYFLRWLFLEQALGHGYRPQRMVVLAIAIFAAFGFIYGAAAKQGLFAPSNPRVFMDETLKKACAASDPPQWTGSACNLNAQVPEYTKFDPYVYSLDVILPIVSLKQREDWQPISRPLQLSVAGWSGELPAYFVRLLVWIESIFAWVWTLSLSAVAAGIIKRD